MQALCIFCLYLEAVAILPQLYSLRKCVMLTSTLATKSSHLGNRGVQVCK